MRSRRGTSPSPRDCATSSPCTNAWATSTPGDPARLVVKVPARPGGSVGVAALLRDTGGAVVPGLFLGGEDLLEHRQAGFEPSLVLRLDAVGTGLRTMGGNPRCPRGLLLLHGAPAQDLERRC